jgi:glycosyltransferase involved in cell wall biosynthesis
LPNNPESELALADNMVARVTNPHVALTAAGQDWRAAGRPEADLRARPGAPPMKRLLVVTHAGEIGGAEYVLLDVVKHYGARCHVLLFAQGPLTERLAALGIGYTVLSAGSAMTGVRREAPRRRVLASMPSVAGLAVRVAAIARRYDVIYPNSQKAAVVTMLVARLIRRPVVWHMHDILSPEHFAPLQRWLVTRLANFSARRVIVVSEAARASFIQSGGDPARTAVVYNGFDDRPFSAIDRSDVDRIRRNLGIGDAPLVGLFGRIARWKGQHVLLRALPDLPGVHALIVGEALFGETGYLDELVTLATELGVADRVHWLGHRADIPVLMRAVDLVLHTSTSAEPFGRVIVEGMLAARPVLAADHGASRELLGDEPLALMPPGNPGLLAQAVRRILGLSHEARAHLGARNRARARDMFSLHAALAGIETAIALDEPA